MSAIQKRQSYEAADLTYEAVVANLNGGEVVMASTTATSDPTLQGIVAATDAALTVLGVAAKPCITTANQAAASSGNLSQPGAYPFVDAGIVDAQTAVYNDFVGPVTYTAAAVAYGTRLVAAAAGAVRAFVAGTDNAAAVIGWCAQPGGVSSAGGTALARIRV